MMRRPPPILWFIPIIVFVGALPLFIQQQNVLNLGFMVLLSVTIGQSWNLLAGFTGQYSLGHAAFFGVGALLARWLWLGVDVPIVAAVAAGGVAAAGVAMVVGVPAFRLRGAYFAIGTLALGEMLHAVVAQTMPYIDTLPAARIGQYDLASRYYLAYGVALLVVGTAVLLRRLPVGLGLVAVREDEEAAQANGVHPLRHKLLALALSAFYTGVAGGVFAYHQISYYPQAVFGITWTFDGLLISFIGGLGSVAGPVIGAVFYVALREALAATFASLNLVVFGVLFIVVVLAFPGGLVEVGRWVRHRYQRLWPR